MHLKNCKLKLFTPPVFAFAEFESPCFVETDPSSILLGLVLAQGKEINKVDTIRYVSHAMTLAERKYLAFEREALAVIFAINLFKV